MISKCLISFLMICVLASAGISQQTYSESTGYKPRQFAESKKERKKKADDNNQLVVPPNTNVEGEVTVTIPVAVLDRTGSAIGGVTRQEVSVFVDDIEVPISTFEQDKEPLNVILMLDSSPSAAFRFEKMKEQAKTFINALPSEMKVMVVDFNTEMNMRSQPTTDRTATQAAISKKIKMGDGTSIYGAVQILYEKVLPSVAGQKVIVLMTDGVDTTSEKSTFAKSLAAVEKDDVTIYPVYVDTFADRGRLQKNAQDWIAQVLGNVNRNTIGTLSSPPGSSEVEYKKGLIYLQDLASASGGRVLSSEKLEDGTKSLLSEFANRYYVTVKVPRKNAGSRMIRVRINRPSLAVFARGSFVEK
jgi:VWFA-related protein